MKIAICDDNMEYITVLQDYLDSMNNNELRHDTFMSGEALICAYEKRKANYDVVFLDMEMNGMDGIDTAIRIRNMDRHVIIIFVTSHTKYMQKSFECEPFRFLVKPVSLEVFKKTYDAICIRLSQERTTFVFSEGRDRIRLYSEDIIYFEKRSHLIYIYTENEIYKTRKSMVDLVDCVDKNIFCFPHKSFIVNMNFIKKIDEKGINLYGSDEIIPISRANKKELTNSFMNYKERKIIL